MRPERLLLPMLLIAGGLVSGPVGAQDIDGAGAQFELAAQLMAEGDRAGAYPHLVRLTDERAPFPEAYLFRGSIERERGELSQAERAFLRGLEVSPTHRALRLELAVTLSWEGRTREALAAYDEVLRRDPTDRAAAVGRARMLFWLGEHERSIAAFEAVLERDGENLEALVGLADVHRARLRRRRARSLYGRALRADPSFGPAREGLSKVPDATRAEVRVDLGLATSAAGFSGRGGLGLTAHLTPELGLVADFRQDLQRNDLAMAQTGGVSLVGRVGSRLTLRAGYEIQVAEELRTHRLPLGLAVRVSETWTLMASTRPGVREDGRAEHLSMVGSEHRVGILRWTLQVFRGDRADLHETVAALAGDLDFGRVGVRVGVAGALAEQSYATLGAQVRVSLSSRHDLVLGFDHFTLGSRHLFSIGYRGRL